MIPPSPMLTNENRVASDLPGRGEKSPFGAFLLLGASLFLGLLAGCTPAGPRALLDGQRLVNQGKYPQAIEKLKAATVLLGGTNAQAWNWLGVAYHHAGQAVEADHAYQRALALDRDLSEVRFNLGCLRLAEGRLDAARNEFTAYTLQRPHAVEGFVKLGEVELRARQPGAAEKDFDEALRLSPQNPEALNGLGLARLQRGRASEAAQCFQSALKRQADYQPALLNLAIVAQEYLRDPAFALQKYREYLALKPPPANAAAIAATVRQLEQELTPPTRPVAASGVVQPSRNTAAPKPAVTSAPRSVRSAGAESTPSKPRPAPAHVERSEPASNAPRPAVEVAAAPQPKAEVVRLTAEPEIKPARDVTPAPAPAHSSRAEPETTTSSTSGRAAEPKAARRGFFQRVNPLNLLRSGQKTPVQPTPLGAGAPSSGDERATTTGLGPDTAASLASPSSGTSSARYPYKSPAKPAPGNRVEAERAFAQGVQAYQAHRIAEAVKDYRQATQLDPSLFEAHYNLGLAETEQGNLPLALTAYEHALAIRPRSLDARYNLALVLKQAGYLTDAVNELKRVLAIYPNEPRAHLALGNLYAQQFRQPALARPHYMKVLEIEPHDPQAEVIREWLAANPP